MINLLLREIERFHNQLDTAAGVRDFGLIESAVNAPFQNVFGQELYPTIFDKGAKLFHGLTMNHGFIDGNKRVAAHALNVFLRINGLRIDVSDEEFYRVAIETASGKITADDLKFWLVRNVTGKIFITGKITINI